MLQLRRPLGRPRGILRLWCGPDSRRRPPPYEADGLDGSAGGVRKFTDYRMESAPFWDGELPEAEYREYARKLKLWLIEARAPAFLLDLHPILQPTVFSGGSLVRGGYHLGEWLEGGSALH